MLICVYGFSLVPQIIYLFIFYFHYFDHFFLSYVRGVFLCNSCLCIILVNF